MIQRSSVVKILFFIFSSILSLLITSEKKLIVEILHYLTFKKVS